MNTNLAHFIGLGTVGGMGLGIGLGIMILLLWSTFWKGLALWHSAKNSLPYWFVAFLFINTAGILEIIFLFAVLKLRFEDLLKK